MFISQAQFGAQEIYFIQNYPQWIQLYGNTSYFKGISTEPEQYSQNELR